MSAGQRLPSDLVRPLAEELVSLLGGHAIICGSLRRLRPTAGDVDLVLDGIPLSEALVNLRAAGLELIEGGLGPRTELRFGRLKIDLWEPIDSRSVGAAVFHATGSGMHNTVMRRWAREVHGLSITWAGVHDREGRRLDDGTEDGIRDLIGWPRLTPEEREIDPRDPPEWVRSFLTELDRRGL